MGIRFFSTKDRPFHLGPYPFAMDREAGIAAYEAMITADE